MPTIGRNIQRARERLGWTQDELAQKMGYKSRTSIFNIEHGITDLPQSKIAEFARVLGTSPANLLGLVDEETQAKTDVIARVVVRMRSDDSFRDAVICLNEFDEEQFQKAKIMLALL